MKKHRFGLLKRFLSNLHVYVLWLLFSVLFWGWIFGFVTDARPEKKVTLFVSAEAVEDTALAAALESALPEGLRLVKVHPISYAFFQTQELESADLYVLRESELEADVGFFRPLPLAPGDAVWSKDGTVYALRCYDAAADRGAAGSYIDYRAGGEDCYLCFGARSVHAEDAAAEGVARRFLELE